METLKLEHLAPYLPYQLKCNVQGEGNKEFEIVGLNTGFVEYHEIGRTVTEQCCYEDFFPILRPLSDLTKEIQYSGKNIIPFIELAKIELGEISNNKLSNKIQENDLYLETELLPSFFALYFNKNNVTFSRWDDGEGTSSCCNDLLFKLFEWHFDVFGLIKNGLAIDINTIK